MRRLLYRSRATDGVGTAEVFDIVAVSQRNNPDRGITGFLMQDGDRFVQFVEGRAAAVEVLLDDLAHDTRHTGLEILYDASGEERWFAGWDMKHLITFGGTPAMEELRQVLGSTPERAEVLALVDECLSG
ncbi:BLUF domain-containing protein [Tsuneonella amylolytica]|uniref:BLUF domain-containing protein n=1 Tax=Tsuneonella amylolytica TaxID=2338327 RepID=UPI0013C44F80|nr:BLUF domain-containing protein [Tsuneonella amylolytica]